MRHDFAQIIGTSFRVWIYCREGHVRTDMGLEAEVDTAELIRWLRSQGWAGGSGNFQLILMWKPEGDSFAPPTDVLSSETSTTIAPSPAEGEVSKIIYQRLDQAIRYKLKVQIKYQTPLQDIKELVISPIRWNGQNDVWARCDPEEAEQGFSILRILQCESLAGDETLAANTSAQGLPMGTSSATTSSGTPSSDPSTSKESSVERGQASLSSAKAPPLRLEKPPALPSAPTVKEVFRASPSVGRRRQSAHLPTEAPFSQVKSAAEWTRLLDYYRECLLIENRQQYVVDNSNLLQLHTTRMEEALGFLQGQTVLEYQRTQGKNRTQEENFIARGTDNTLKRLCFGYPLLVLQQGKLAPLLYCPVEVKEQPEKYLLSAADFEVSYAVLHALRLGKEEIAAFLSATAQPDTSQQNEPLSALLDCITNHLSELLAFRLEFSATRDPYSLLSSPGLFWVDANIATQNLIKELELLSQPAYWNQAPISLRTLLSLTPDHEYPQSPTLEQDPTFYVSTVNPSQAHAVAAARIEPITVVTGPPGTGKSELVLNIIADASFAGRKTLFASHNNPAVDVVMNRLQNEPAYPGAIRTGNKDFQRSAAQHIERALNESGAHASGVVAGKARESYAQARSNAVDAGKQLEQIKTLNGLLDSQRKERDDWRQRLSGLVAKLAAERMPPYLAVEVNQFQDRLAELRQQLWSLQQRESELAAGLQQLLVEDSGKEPVVQQLMRFENQWGPFGDNFLQGSRAKEVLKISDHIQTWLQLVPALDAKLEEEKARRECEKLEKTFEKKASAVVQRWMDAISVAAQQYSASELATLEAEFGQLALQFSQIAEYRPSFWERLAIRLRLRSPMRNTLRTYRQWEHRIKASGAKAMVNEPPDAAALAEECHQREVVARAAQVFQLQVAAAQTLEDCRVRCASTALALPETMQNDLARLEQIPSVSPSFRTTLTTLLSSAEDLQMRVDALASRTNDLIDANGIGLAMLRQFKQASGDAEPRLWVLSLSPSTIEIDRHLNKWHALASMWTAEAAVRELIRKLSALPSESDTMKRLDESQSTMLRLSREVLREHWFERASALSNFEMREVRDYAEALNILSGSYDRTTYPSAKGTMENCFRSVLGLFGSWATTNLSAKSNLPLDSGLFDLLIIDEASQCDIASALPLIYRAKRVVIIGDPNQLKHVATIEESADTKVAEHLGVAREAFGFRGQSLYDLARRSVGNRPGPLLLNEHYRSDARVIAFSNEEFYGGKLKVKTDLTRRGFPRSFLNDCGGITWWHVPGTTRRPPRGSAYNMDEFNAIRELLPQLIKSVKPYGLGEGDVGIVTPFRDQANRIHDWCKTSSADPDAIRVGTAHVFQGDERHIMIISPVLSSGIPEGTLRWLTETANLLNVAVTRARIAVIVVGDWEFCCHLPTNSIYRKLADHVAARNNRVVKEVAEIPLLGGPPFPIVGQVIDPHNPEHNRTTLRRFLGACRDYVWWLDNYFNNKVIDLLADIFDSADCRLREVRLLTNTSATEATDGRKPELDPKRIGILAASLASRGVLLEARALTKKELGVHDRLLFSPGQAINMPPFGATVGQHHFVSEYTASNINKTLFEELWLKAKAIS